MGFFLVSTIWGMGLISIAMADVAPINNGVLPMNVPEDTVRPITTLSVTDVDTATGEKLDKVTLSVKNGKLTVPHVGILAIGGTVVRGATLIAGTLGTETFTLKGDGTQLNAALKNLEYKGTLNFDGTDVLTIVSTDLKGKEDRDTANITVTQVSHSSHVCDWSKSGSKLYPGDLGSLLKVGGDWLGNWAAGPAASYSLVQYNLADKKSSLNAKALGAGLSFRYYRSDHLTHFWEKFLNRPLKPIGPSNPTNPKEKYAEDTVIADIPAGCRAQTLDLTGNDEKIASWYSIAPTMYVFQEENADKLGVQFAFNFGFLNDIFNVGVGWNLSGQNAGEWFLLVGPSYGFRF